MIQYFPVPMGSPPQPSPKRSYGEVRMVFKRGILELCDILPRFKSKWPMDFDELSVRNGIVVYSTRIPYKIVSYYHFHLKFKII